MTTRETVSARVSRRMDVSAEQVFDAWIDPDKIRIWMSAALLQIWSDQSSQGS